MNSIRVRKNSEYNLVLTTLLQSTIPTQVPEEKVPAAVDGEPRNGTDEKYQAEAIEVGAREKAEGNEKFKAGEFKQAERHYSGAIDLYEDAYDAAKEAGNELDKQHVRDLAVCYSRRVGSQNRANRACRLGAKRSDKATELGQVRARFSPVVV